MSYNQKFTMFISSDRVESLELFEKIEKILKTWSNTEEGYTINVKNDSENVIFTIKLPHKKA